MCADGFCNLLCLVQNIFCVTCDEVVDKAALQRFGRGEPVSLERDFADGLGVGYLGLNNEAERVWPASSEEDLGG